MNFFLSDAYTYAWVYFHFLISESEKWKHGRKKLRHADMLRSQENWSRYGRNGTHLQMYMEFSTSTSVSLLFFEDPIAAHEAEIWCSSGWGGGCLVMVSWSPWTHFLFKHYNHVHVQSRRLYIFFMNRMGDTTTFRWTYIQYISV